MKKLIACIAAAASAATILPSGFIVSAQTQPVIPDGYAAYFSFDDTEAENEKLTVIKPGEWQGTNPASGADENAQAVYSDRKARNGKSLDLSNGNYGVMLDDTIPANSSYTVSFWGYVTENVSCNNPAVFIDANSYADDNSVEAESWHRICPYGGNSRYDQEYVFQYYGNNEVSIVWSGIKDDSISGAWHMFTTTFDTNAYSSSVKLYLDGKEVTNSNKDLFVPDLASDGKIYVGVNPWAGWDGTFKGYIDDLYVYDSALSADQVAGMYTEYVAPPEDYNEQYSDSADISALYTFNENSDNNSRDTVKDRSGNGNDASLYGASAYIYDEEKQSKVLYTSGVNGSYMEFPLPKDENGNVSEYFTVSMDIKNLTEGNYFNFYVGDGSSKSSGSNYYGYKISNDILLSAKGDGDEIKTTLSGKGVQGGWAHVDFVLSDGVCNIYVNGTKAGTMKGYSMNTVNASVGRLSFSGWSADAYAKAYYENVVVYDKALSDTGIASLSPVNDPNDNIDENDISLDISSEKGVDIQDGTIGLFFEDINYAADGGLYAEMVENRSFESRYVDKNNTTPRYDGGWAWSAYPSGKSGAVMEYKTDTPLNDNNTHYLEFTPSSSQNGFANAAYDGLALKKDMDYHGSLFAKTDNFNGAVKVSAVKDGKTYAEAEINGLTNEWTKYSFDMTSSDDIRGAQLVITADGTGTIDFDMISLFPGDAVDGLFRRDLAELLKDLKPGFLRFPGGCIIEGYNLDNRYQWKQSVGPVESRVENWNRWDLHTTGYNHYNQTLGLGFYEYFLLCEYLECRPVPVLNVGLACEYQTSETVPVYEADGKTYTAEFYQYIQDALDLIEFANSTDFENSEWARLRREMGHPEPFNLDMIGIGNEQWEKNNNQWFERYEAFEKEIHKVYPDMKLVGTSGPGVQDNDYNNAWNWIRENMAVNPNFVSVVDEHYYREPNWFYENINFYDNYPRNVKVFAGEYASRRRNLPNDPEANTWETALSEASYLTMVERNADVVYMASYAPLFARLGYTQWSPDMIWFDDAESYGTPTYYIQKLYSTNMGDYTLKSELNQLSPEPWLYQNTSYDTESGDIIIKIANSGASEMSIPVSIDDSFTLTGTADIMQIAENDLNAVNSIEDPYNVSPTETTMNNIENDFNIELPAYSFTVIRVNTKSGSTPTVENAVYENDNVTFTLNNQNGKTVKAYAAEYTSDGTLAGVGLTQVTVSSDSETISVPLTLNNENNTVKLFVWENDQDPITNGIYVKQ